MKKIQLYLSAVILILSMILNGCGVKSAISQDDPIYQKWNIVSIEDKKGLAEYGTIVISRDHGDGLTFNTDGTMELLFNSKPRTATFTKEQDGSYSYIFDKANAKGEIYSGVFFIEDDTITLNINSVKFIFAVEGSEAEANLLEKCKKMSKN